MKIIKPQTSAAISDKGELTKSGKLDIDKLRKMRKDPTIFLARLMVRAPILLSSWTVEQDDVKFAEVAEFIRGQLLPHREYLLRAATANLIDHGWCGFEQVFVIENGHIKIDYFKALLDELTTIQSTTLGLFDGFSQPDDVRIPKMYSLLIALDPEGDDLYGQSYMGNAELAYDASVLTDEHARIYDKKIAGAHWIIYFPDGVCTYNGQETATEVVAQALIDTLENSGSFAIPSIIKEQLAGLTEATGKVWEVQLIEASGSGANFDERLTRADKLKVRAFGFPERAILEGLHGTKAEAGAHGDFALLGIELLHTSIINQLNKQVVNQLIELNFGLEAVGKVYLTAQPLSDASVAMLQQLYQNILSQPDGFMHELGKLDIDAIRDRLNIPYVEDGTDFELADEALADSKLPVADPGATPTGAPVVDSGVKAVALNGAQVTSLQEIVINAQNGMLPVSAAKAMCKIAFGIDQAAVDELFASVVPKSLPTPPAA